MFSYTDNISWDGRRGVWASFRERGDLNGDGYVDSKGMNAEHTWPHSFFRKRGPMKSDLHHLMPTFIDDPTLADAIGADGFRFQKSFGVTAKSEVSPRGFKFARRRLR